MSHVGPPGVTSKAKVAAIGKKLVAFEVDEAFVEYIEKNKPSGVLSFLPDGDEPPLGDLAAKPASD